MRSVLHFLGSGGGSMSGSMLAASSQDSGLALALPLKRTPNSLCARLRNFDAVCARLQGTPWVHSMLPPREDEQGSRSGSSGSGSNGATRSGLLSSWWLEDHSALSTGSQHSGADQCWASACGSHGGASAHLVLGGSHHKTGTVLLERLLGAYATSIGAGSLHKPSWERCPSLQRKEAGVCVDEHLTAPKLRRLFLGPLGAGALLGAPLIHAVREPLEACVSAYQYHLHSSESWLRQPRTPSAASNALGLSASLAGVPWQEVLQQLDLRSGALAECRRSIQDQVSQQAEAFNATRGHSNVFTLRMEETQGGVYDRTMRTLYSFLVGARAHWPGAEAARRADRSSPAVSGVGSGSVPRSSASAGRDGPMRFGEPTGNDKESTEVASLVEAASRFDISRHRSANDDGHLSSLQQKRQLRGILLNATGLAHELDGWREATGYDRAYSDYCRRYGYAYHAQAVSDGFISTS